MSVPAYVGREIVAVDLPKRVDPSIAILLPNPAVLIPVPTIKPWLICHVHSSAHRPSFNVGLTSISEESFASPYAEKMSSIPCARRCSAILRQPRPHFGSAISRKAIPAHVSPAHKSASAFFFAMSVTPSLIFVHVSPLNASLTNDDHVATVLHSDSVVK